MEALLPSEIARLVLGYLEEQNCGEAAAMFLASSPHLVECRAVASSGKRFSTKVNGMTLMDIIEKFCAVNSMIQERLSKIADCEQLKHCGDLLEQLKFIVEETRGQRFVVNINVPSQANPQTSGGSPIISSSMRKRRHSNNERERHKRLKSCSSGLLQRVESSAVQLSSDVVQTTSLESLPGHIDSSKHVEQCTSTSDKQRRESTIREPENECGPSKSLSIDVTGKLGNGGKDGYVNEGESQDSGGDSGGGGSGNATDSGPVNQDAMRKGDGCTERKRSNCLEKCTTATSTEELSGFCCAEVQTTPYDTPESESETNDEPIENLSLLTKELLNRTELQERIAENINKAMQPSAEVSLKDDALSESINGETNTSIMAELNNAIKSIVEATESDPVFEQFLDEIIGPNTETDTSPDEDIDTRPDRKSATPGSREKQPEMPANVVAFSEPATLPDNQLPSVTAPSLQPGNEEEEKTEVQEPPKPENEQTALEDQNAAAILSIINANIIGKELVPDGKIPEQEKEVICLDDEEEGKFPPAANKPSLVSTVKPIVSTDEKLGDVTTIQEKVEEPRGKKSCGKRSRAARSKRAPEPAPGQEIITVPTLIIYAKEETKNYLSTSYPGTRSATAAASGSQFVPIAPKDGKPKPELSTELLYLRTVNVPHTVPAQVTQIAHVAQVAQLGQQQVLANAVVPVAGGRGAQQPGRKTVTKPTIGKVKTEVGQPIPAVTNSVPDKLSTGESITLYGNENIAKTLLDSNDVPTISLEENISLSGIGLSPYLRFNCSKSSANYSLSEIDLISTENGGEAETVPEAEAASTETSERARASKPNTGSCDVINKRTPRSLLRSRSKNHRLSLSTPRRRSSHIRALDFSTPIKGLSSSKASIEKTETDRLSPRQAKHLKSVCRTSLFKSPPFQGATAPARKSKSPIGDRCDPAVATAESAKLAGLDRPKTGDASSKDESSAPVAVPARETRIPKPVKQSWDADLRKVLHLDTQAEQPKKPQRSKKKDSSSATSKCDPAKKCTTRGLKTKGSKKMYPAEEEEEDGALEELPSRGRAGRNSKPNTRNVAREKKSPGKPGPGETSQGKNVPVNGTSGPANNNEGTGEKKIVKKYAQLKTISSRTAVKKVTTEAKSNIGIDVAAKPDPPEITNTGIGTQQNILARLPDLVDLDSPRKFDIASGIPATPRLLSPSSNAVTPFIKISEDSTKVRGIVTTPEFPTTPCIALTPKHADDTADNTQKEGFGACSSYYRPISEQNGKERLVKANPAPGTGLSLPAASVNTFQTCVSAKLEITQFEVIKENLPKEEAVKELKISAGTRDLAASLSITKLKAQTVVKQEDVNKPGDGTSTDFPEKGKSQETGKPFKYRGEAFTDTDASSSSSSSSSESSSSSSTSSSSSSSSSTSASSASSGPNAPERYNAEGNAREAANKISSDRIYTDTSNDSTGKGSAAAAAKLLDVLSVNAPVDSSSEPKSVNIVTTGEQRSVVPDQVKPGESSPLKVFSLVKNEQELIDCAKETPSKDDSLLNEANISETPSGSKNGIESLTNLSSKISAMIDSERRSSSEKRRDGPAPVKPVKEQGASLPEQSTGKSGESSVATSQRSLSIERKLVLQLEAKRQRMIAKFREIPKSRATGCRGAESRQRRSILREKNQLTARRRNNRLGSPGKRNPRRALANQGADAKPESAATAAAATAAVVATSNDAPSTSNRNPRLTRKSSKTETSSNPPDGPRNEKIPTRVRTVKDTTAGNTVEEKTGRSDKPRIEQHSCPVASRAKAPKPETRPVKSKHNEAETVKLTVELKQDCQVEIASSRSNKEEQMKCLFKSKVDQVKRDLFSDEENDQRGQNGGFLNKDSTGENSKVLNNLTNASDPTVVPSTGIEAKEGLRHDNVQSSLPRTDTENQGDLSRVLECLELIPASKGDQANGKKDAQREGQQERKDKVREEELEEGELPEEEGGPEDVKEAVAEEEEEDEMLVEEEPDADEEEEDEVAEVGGNEEEEEDVEEDEEEEEEEIESEAEPEEETREEAAEQQRRNKTDLNGSASNSVEYHFLYDENVTAKKRRRKYSNRELELQVNILTDQEQERCIKMTATDYEEIFHLAAGSRKRPTTTTRGRPAIRTRKKSGLTRTNDSGEKSLAMARLADTKPLATSSPLDKTVVPKIKREKAEEKQSESKKRSRSEKPETEAEARIETERRMETEKHCNVVSTKEPHDLDLRQNPNFPHEPDLTSLPVKTRKRKASETKDAVKQAEKKFPPADPRLLLSNVDLDKFLTSVHGPA